VPWQFPRRGPEVRFLEIARLWSDDGLVGIDPLPIPSKRCYRPHFWSMLPSRRGRRLDVLPPLRSIRTRRLGENAVAALTSTPHGLVLTFIQIGASASCLKDLIMFSATPNGMPARSGHHHKFSSAAVVAPLCAALLFATTPAAVFASSARPQQTDPAAPVVVQPGAPGKPTKTLPPSTRATLPPVSHADVEFMQGMIMHHSQAVEMTALIESHTDNQDLRSLGARISSSQSDEIRFMKRWLATRGESISMPMFMPEMPGMKMDGSGMPLMPGMLSPQQMTALRNAKGAEFDRLFLTGMIQHHGGALTMVKDLFDTAGAGQDAEIFDFATDADNSQKAEIKIMQSMLDKKPSEEKR